MLAATTPFRVTTSTALYGFWTIPGTAIVLPNVASDPAVRADIQIRVWDNRGGTITSWDQIYDPATGALRPGKYGWSDIFTTRDQLGGGVVLPPTLIGLQSFELICVPEPSTVAFLVFAGAGLLLWTRRWRKPPERSTV